MSQTGNVVALPLKRPALPVRPAGRLRYSAGRLSDLERHFTCVALSDINVTFGVMHGEPLLAGQDFILGDMIVISHRCAALAANDHSMATGGTAAFARECATLKTLAEFADVQRLTLMDAHGAAQIIYAVTPKHRGMRAPYVLMPRHMETGRQFTVIQAATL